MQKKTAMVQGVFSAVAVLILGFSMMLALWKMIGSPNGLPGLFDYRAATIGDAICLPILMGTSVAFNRYNKTQHDRHKAISCMLALAVSAIAAVIQATWLIRDDTVLNWSIPIQHHFNIAGWYHSLFFIGMFGVLTYQLSSMWFHIRERQGDNTSFERWLCILFAFAGMLFISMFATDDYSQYIPAIFLLPLVSVMALLILALYFGTSCRKINKLLFSALLVGVISSYCISLLLCVPVKGDMILAVGGGLCACFLWRIEKNSVLRLLFKDAFAITVYAGGLYVISGLPNVSEMIFTFVFLSVLTVLLEYMYTGEMRNRCFSMIAVGIYILLNCFFWVNISPFIDISKAAFTGGVMLFFSKEIKDYFSVLVDAEIKRNKNQINKEQLRKTKCKVYLQIVIGILATAILLLRWLSDVAKARGSRIDTGSLNSMTWSILCVLTVCFFLLAVFGIKKLRKYMLTKITAILVSILILGMLITLIIINIGMLPSLDWTLIKWVMMACSTCACVGAAVLSAHGYYMNVVLLRGLPRKRMALVMSVIQFIGNLMLNIAIAVLLLSQQTKMSLLLILIVTIFAYVVLPVLHARVIQYEHQIFHVVGNSILGGIAQDGLTVGSIILFAVCMPCLYISMMKGIDGTVVLGGIVLIGVAFPPVKFCICNNVKHMDQQKKVLEDYPNEEGMWNVLHKCLVRQSIQTIIAMLPYVCIVAGKEFVQKLCQSKTWKEAMKELINTYIDKDEYGKKEDEEKQD